VTKFAQEGAALSSRCLVVGGRGWIWGALWELRVGRVDGAGSA